LADEYRVSVKMDAKPFEILESKPTVIPKSEIQPGQKQDDVKID
jgi:hypothetical protein